MSKIVSQLNADGVFIGQTEADLSPLEKDVWLLPALAVDLPPPNIPNGKLARYQNGAFVFEDLPLPTPPAPPTPAEIIATYTAAIQDRLDDFARTRNYDGILSAATYATSAVPKFKVEGQYAVEARDATWAKGYEILAAAEAGTRPLPTLEGLAAELPALAWPK